MEKSTKLKLMYPKDFLELIIPKFILSLFGWHKISLDGPQYDVIVYIAKELKLSKEEVLWMYVELGQSLAIASQNDPAVRRSLNEREKHLSEYKNWERIAKLNYDLHKEGENHPR